MRKCISPRRALVCAVFVVGLCGLYFVPTSVWLWLLSIEYRVLRAVGPVFRGSCLPGGPPPPHVNIAVVTLNHEKDELYEVRINPQPGLLLRSCLGIGVGGRVRLYE